MSGDSVAAKVDKRSSKKNVHAGHVTKKSGDTLEVKAVEKRGSARVDKNSRHSSKKSLVVENPADGERSTEKTTPEKPEPTILEGVELGPMTREEMIEKIQELLIREAELKQQNSELDLQCQFKRKEKARLVAQSDHVQSQKEKQAAASGDFIPPKVSDLNRKYRPNFLDKEGRTHRENVVCEFLTTEQSYWTTLEILVRVYHDGLDSYIKANPKLIDASMLEKLFQNLVNIQTLNGRLCEALETRLTEWEQPGKDHLADIFLTLGVKLKGSYCTFGGYYEAGQKMYHHQYSTNPHWKKLFDSLDAHVGPATNGLTFPSFYIQPVQRVPRYCLLLRDLLKATPESHHDYLSLTKAGEEMDTVASQINAKIKEADIAHHFDLVVNRRFKRLKDEPVLEPGARRIWVKDGEIGGVIDVSEPKRGQNAKSCELILFGDCLVATAFLNKKCPIQEATLPTKVLWMTNVLTEKDKELIVGEEATWKFAAKLSGPESTWLVAFKTNADRLTWQTAIVGEMGVLVSGLADAAAGKRKGRYVFQSKGTYNGEWLNGEIHGVGKLVTTDGAVYSGRWDHVSKSGFGETHVGLSGWKDQGQTVAPIDPHAFWKHDALLDRDWQLMLCKGKTTNFPKGELIITQGKKNTRMIKLIKGELAIEKVIDPDKPPLQLKVLQFNPEKATILGETAVIPTIQQATANVRAHTDIDIVEVHIQLLFNIFESEPGVAMRFYRWVAQGIAEKIRDSHGPKTAPPPKKDGDEESSSEDEVPRPSAAFTASSVPSSKGKKPGKDKKDKKDKDAKNKGQAKKQEAPANYHFKFNLGAQEVLLKQTPAKLHGWKDKAGTFYVFSNTLVFEYAPVFGSALHENILIDSITSLTGDEKSEEIRIDTKHKKYRLVLQKEFVNIFTFTEKLYLDSQNKVGDASSKKAAFGGDSEQAGASGKPQMTRTISKSNMISKKNIKGQLGESETGINMGPEDWRRLLEGATEAHYRKGDKIVAEGQKHQRIYHISTGTCDIMKETADGPKHIVTLPQDSVFGELTFLDPRNQQATASVIAGSDDCTVNIVEGSWINLVMVDHPEIAGRFYNYLCSILAKRLSEREMEMQAEREKQKKLAAKAEEPQES